jgi:hypothetical protein
METKDIIDVILRRKSTRRLKTEKHQTAEMLSAEIDEIATTQPWLRRSM